MSFDNFRKFVPWWVRIYVKIFLSRLPIPYIFWKKLKLFEHGDMNDSNKALNIFLMHAKQAGVLDKEALHFKIDVLPFSVLELGPGDALFTAVISRAFGATNSWLVDAGEYASNSKQMVARYISLAEELGVKLQHSFGLKAASLSLETILDACCSKYLTEGVNSMALIPNASVDFCFSNAVLEHIPKLDFEKLAIELRRVLKKTGVCIHRVDLRDHLGGGLNNLRFSDSIWESTLFKKSGFYTNRFRFSEILNIFTSAGFKCEVTRKLLWPEIPLPLLAIDSKFHCYRLDDLRVMGFDVVLRCAD